MPLNYDPATIQWTDPAEPVELRLADRTGAVRYVLTAWRTAHGTVAISLTNTGQQPNALSNLQTTRHFPGKAIPGWQRECIQAAQSGIYTIDDIR